MIQALTSVVTLSAMLLHVLLGCCAHHIHLEPNAPTNSATATGCSHRLACCGGHRAHAPADEETGDEETPRHGECHEDACQYLTSSKVELPASDDSLPAVVPQIALATGSTRNLTGGVRGKVPIDRGETLTLRPHALHGVWLV